MGVIDKAHVGVVIDSAYGYKEAVNNFCTEKMLDDSDFKLKGYYTFSDLKKLGLNIGGQLPTDKSWVHIDDNVVTDYSLKFDDYVVNYDEQNIVTRGDVEDNPGLYFMNNINYYIDTLIVKNNPVYYNPVIGKKCTKEEYEKSYNSTTKMYDNSKIGFKGTDTNGCMKWYKYSVNADESVNMILDHNTSVGVSWSQIDNNDQKANNALKVMNGLLEDRTIGDTTHWSDKLIRHDKYLVKWKQKMNEDYIITEIDYTGYKARLITAAEIANITHASDEEPNGIGFNEQISTSVNWFYLDGKNHVGIGTDESKKWQKKVVSGESTSSYSWLFDNTYNCVSEGNCTIEQGTYNNYGYWTISPVHDSLNMIWYVGCSGRLNGNNVTNKGYGVRPVITIFE